MSLILNPDGSPVGCQLAVLKSLGGVEMIEADHIDAALTMIEGIRGDRTPFAVVVGGEVVRAIGQDGSFSLTPLVDDLRRARGLIQGRKGWPW
jgi:hypothetical protein